MHLLLHVLYQCFSWPESELWMIHTQGVPCSLCVYHSDKQRTPWYFSSYTSSSAVNWIYVVAAECGIKISSLSGECFLSSSCSLAICLCFASHIYPFISASLVLQSKHALVLYFLLIMVEILYRKKILVDNLKVRSTAEEILSNNNLFILRLSSSSSWAVWPSVCSRSSTATTCSPPSPSWRTRTLWCGSSVGLTSTLSSHCSSTWCCRSSSPSSPTRMKPSRCLKSHTIKKKNTNSITFEC